MLDKLGKRTSEDNIESYLSAMMWVLLKSVVAKHTYLLGGSTCG